MPVVYDVKDTKFEWNSQLQAFALLLLRCCLWCQRYKIWMELTTFRLFDVCEFLLFMMSKIQNLNGTHNSCLICALRSFVVYDVKDTKFEWNSQQSLSLSQLRGRCLWCQRYKIWMELTTRYINRERNGKLFMMSKIQNLNGTHNKIIICNFSVWVVYDVKDTKFEWNSQPTHIPPYFQYVVYDVKDTKFEWNSQLKQR